MTIWSQKGAVMPKQTFFNLPDAKRRLIIDTALEEFAFNTYDKASLSQIVLKAGIAKGSMYQYFNDKDELYTYLVEYVSEKKLSFINEALPQLRNDFFLLYKEVIFVAARFDIINPLYSSFLYSVGKDSHNPAISKKIMASSASFIEQMLEKAYSQGQIRKDINIKLAAFIISYLSVDVGEYIGEKYGFSYLSVLKSKLPNVPISDNQLEEVLDELIDFIKRGIASTI
ncbi:MAG: hypothetical protein CVU91_11900 [Firmicutes bacterium HGW-Firmicutes-16]|nr:MAG: hypothetical protein CVU91_11900 [Firmicutes bacterium HGW-Firmicutes-16]